MKKKSFLKILMVLIASNVLFFSCSNNKSKITVFAAASTTEVMEIISKKYQELNGLKVKLNLASSGKLARQIEAGAPCDVFISASLKWMKYLKDKELINNEHIFLKNSLVLIVNKEVDDTSYKKSGINMLLEIDDKISMGDPEHVPAGAYAKGALEYLGLYNKIKNRILPAQSVRAALSVIELNEAGAGIVYKTDAFASSKVKIISEFPEKSHIPIKYPCAIVKGAFEGSKKFIDFLNSDFAKKIFKEKGFTLPN